MSKKQESLRAELRKILSRGGRSVVNKSSDGKAVPVPEEAEVFEIDFVKDGESYGKVYVSIDGLHQLIVYFDHKVANSPKNGSADSESWEQLTRTLKRFATMKQLSFKLSDMDNLENDMAKREHTKKQETMYEGYHAQGKKASYSDNVPTTKILIQHKRKMEEGEQRYRQIDKIFIENSIGERALAPTDKPGLARVFARHIAEGGKANDDRWNHISGLCEEYGKMAGFVRATRNGQFNESAQQLVAEGINHYQKLRESLGKMSGKRGYNAYFESYTPSLMEDEEQVDLSEMFMSSSLDPRIEGVMPILSKLSKHITETADMEETIALEAWANDISENFAKAAPTSGKPSKQEVAKRMHSILSKGKTTDEGMAGAALGGIAGAALTKSPSGAMSGASLGSQIQDEIMSEEPAKKGKPSDKEVAKKMHSILSKGKGSVAEAGPRAVDDQGNPIEKSKNYSVSAPITPDQLKPGGSYSTNKGVVTKTDTGLIHKARSSFTPTPRGVEEELSMKHQRQTYGKPGNKWPDTKNSSASRSVGQAEMPNVTKTADGHPTVQYRAGGKAAHTRVDPTITPTSVKRKDSDKPIPSFLKKEQGVAEGLDQPREAGKAIQSLKNLAVMKSALTMQQLTQAGREAIVSNAINAAKTLEQSYLQNKQQGNAIFVRALRDEIDNFMRGAPINASFPETDTASELGELLQGKLGKVNFQQGVAEDLDPGQKAAGQFSPKDAYAKPGDLVGTNESIDPLDRIKEIMNHQR